MGSPECTGGSRYGPGRERGGRSVQNLLQKAARGCRGVGTLSSPCRRPVIQGAASLRSSDPAAQLPTKQRRVRRRGEVPSMGADGALTGAWTGAATVAWGDGGDGMEKFRRRNDGETRDLFRSKCGLRAVDVWTS